MDNERARNLLEAERRRLEPLIAGADDDSRSDRDEQDAPGDMSDPAERLTAEGTDDAVAAAMRSRLEAVERAEQRLAAGTFGTSVRSGKPIPDERLEADPAAELTVDEAADEPPAVG